MNDCKNHWEKIYQTKQPHEVSWTEDIPQRSLDLILGLNLTPSAAIIDVGGGDSKLVDHLLEEGFENITVLDISGRALERARQRLGNKSKTIRWIETDILEFVPDSSYDLWHDRAAFHFLTRPAQVDTYIGIAEQAVRENGYMTIGTFSSSGPAKCSGLEVHRYGEDSLTAQFNSGFEKLNCKSGNHLTPFKTKQNFLFCSFQRRGKSHLRVL